MVELSTPGCSTPRLGFGLSRYSIRSDVENVAHEQRQANVALDLVGLGIHADRKIIDKITAALKFLS